MKKRQPFALRVSSILLLVGVLLGISLMQPKQQSQKEPQSVLLSLSKDPSTNGPLHPLYFYDKSNFLIGTEKAKIENQKFLSPIKGGIIPHHLLPGFILAGFYHRLVAQNPQTIILLSPNHYERGNFKVLTSQEGWQTPYGIVGIDSEIVDQILADNLAQVDEQTMDYEHGIGGQTPFIKYYLPQTKIVPLILKRELSEKEIDILASRLAKFVNSSTVLVSSVDFSHYLTSLEAEQKDIVTEQVMESLNYSKLLSLNNDYLDSPPSIALQLKVMEMVNVKNHYILNHTNSGRILNQPFVSTTSYFSIAYY